MVAKEGNGGDEEERELLELQRQQEERRKREDQELKLRLEALKLKKQGTKEKRDDSDRSGQTEKRRRKHKELRKKMTEKGDHSESPQYSSDSDDGDEDSNNRLDDPILGVHMETESYADTSSKTSGDQTDKYDKYSVNINSSHPEKEKGEKHLQDLVDDKTKSDTVDHNFDVNDFIENVLQESQLLGSDTNEPDIVRSTKTRTPPNTLQASTQANTVILPPSGDKSDKVQTEQKVVFIDPVAPPRKKKKLKLTTSGIVGRAEDLPHSQRSSVSSLPSLDDSMIMSEPQSPGLPPERLLGRDANLQRLARDLEHSLDLTKVIKSGRRHIKTEEAEINAVNSDHDSPRDTLDGHVPSPV